VPDNVNPFTAASELIKTLKGHTLTVIETPTTTVVMLDGVTMDYHACGSRNSNGGSCKSFRIQ